MTTEHNRGRSFLLVTDGACLGNPGIGGWSVIIHELDGDAVVSRHAHAGRADGTTTNQRMELTAAYEGLKYLGATSAPITVVSDSQYLVNGMTQWRDGWKERGWRKANRKPVENLDLWIALDQQCPTVRPIYWRWTKGHAGHKLNEAADMLANNAAKGVYGVPVGALADFHPELFSEVIVRAA